MESTANEIDETTTMQTTNTLAENDLPKTNSTSVITIETKPTAVSDEHAINCETVNETKVPTVVNSIDVSHEDELNSAMTSVSISSTDKNEIKQNLDELKNETTIIKNENDIVANTIVNPDVSTITLEPNDDVNSTNTGEFEDTHEYVDEEDSVEKTHLDNGNCVEDNLLDDETNSDKEKNEEVVITTPVPVDDDTNDPQYIPRRGRFYEHDDRMAYSTTTSEGSEFSDKYDENNSDSSRENVERRRILRRHTPNKIRNTLVAEDKTDNDTAITVDDKVSSKKVLAISKVASTTKNIPESTLNSSSGLIKKTVSSSRKSRDIDSLDKWTHDLYDEHDQTRKTRDELLASYGYDIREESEAPRARRHHKYGRAATSKYTRSWQDTKAYIGSGPQSSNVNRTGWRNGTSNKNKNKSTTSDKYTSEFPPLNDSKKSTNPVDVSIIESSSVEKDSSPLNSRSTDQQINIPVDKTTTIDSSQHNVSSSRGSEKLRTSVSNKSPQNDGPTLTQNKNYFQRSSVDSSVNKEKIAQVNRVPTSGINSNFYKRSQYNDSNQNNYTKHQTFNNTYGVSRGHNHNHQNSLPSRGRNFQQNHNHQYNRDRYFSKGAAPFSSNSNPNNTTAGTGRTQHSGGHFNRKYENENEQIEPLVPAPVVRSSKRYSVQSNRELPDPVLNFGGINKTSQQIQPQPQMQPSPQTLQLQSQIHPPPSMQLQQFHQPLQPMHQHHRMVLDHNSGIMVMATADPSIYHHQLYTTPQYANTIAPGPSAGNTEDQNAALQMLAAQAAVYQPVPTGTAIASPTSGVQPDSFMTTYYQPQQQTAQQPPPRRVNLAIPIVAPPEHVVSKSSPIPAQTTASTN